MNGKTKLEIEGKKLNDAENKEDKKDDDDEDLNEFFSSNNNKFINISAKKKLDVNILEREDQKQTGDNNSSKNVSSDDFLWITREFNDVLDFKNFGIIPTVEFSVKRGEQQDGEFQVDPSNFLSNLNEPILFFQSLPKHPNVIVLIGNKMKVIVAALIEVLEHEIKKKYYKIISEFHLTFLEKAKEDKRDLLADLKRIKKHENQEITSLIVDEQNQIELLHFFTNNDFDATYTFDQFKSLVKENSLVSDRLFYEIFPDEEYYQAN